MEASRHEQAVTEILDGVFGPSVLVPLKVDGRVVHCFRLEAGGSNYFLKLLPAGSGEAAANTLLPADLNCPVLLHHGVTSTGKFYLVFEWVDLRRFEPTTESIVAAGEIVGRLHIATRGLVHPDVPARGPVSEEIASQVRSIAHFDGDIASRLSQLLAGLGGRCDVTDGYFPRVLVHGDVAWHNLGLDRRGRVMLFDFEAAAIGTPLLELVRSWFGDLRDEPDRELFLNGYCGVTGFDRAAIAEGRLPLELLRGVRFLLSGLIGGHDGLVRDSLQAIEDLQAVLARRPTFVGGAAIPTSLAGGG